MSVKLPTTGDLFEGRYRLEHELGAGGFSVVFHAWDESIGRAVALKVLRPERGRYERATQVRFEREVSIIASLQSPYSVTLYTYGTSAAGLLYMVFEHVPGEDLSDRLVQQGTLPAAEVREILRQLLTALREAHSGGLIHRDIKPQNVRVSTPPGTPINVKLLDFGIARSTDDGSPSVTKTGEILGTPRYMSPEQLRGQPLTVASDLYSLGMVAFELLVGEDGLAPNHVGAQLDRLKGGFLLGAERAGQIDADLLTILQRLTAAEPADRFPSAAAVLSTLARPYQTPRSPGVSREVSIVEEPADNWTNRLIAVAVVGLAVAALWVAHGRDGEETEQVRVAPLAPQPASALMKQADEPAPPPAEDLGSPDIATNPDAAIEGGSPGCGNREPDKQFGNVIYAHTPEDYAPTKPYPAILWFMADHDRHTRVPNTDRFRRLIEAEDVIVFTPLGAVANRWRPTQASHVNRGVEWALNNYCLRPEQLFIMSTGGSGMLATRLSCEPWAAAVAVSSFLGPAEALERCSPTLWITAKDSVHLPIGGGDTCMSKLPIIGSNAPPAEPYEKIERRMRELYSCRGRAVKREPPGAVCETWKCEIPFESCLTPGGIGWPGTPQADVSAIAAVGGCDEPPPSSFDATAHAWAFFQQVSSGSE